MKPLLVHLDEDTYRALAEIMPPSTRKRAQFIRDAIRKAVREAEYERIREAYSRQPDSEAEADDWSSAGEWKP